VEERLVLHAFGDADRSGKVRWVAAELGLPVEEARVRPGEHRGAPYTDLNPMARIPTVQWRGRVLTESTAICHELAEAHDAPKLWVGPGEEGRSAYLYWLATFGETLEGRLVECAVSRGGLLGPEYYGLHEASVRQTLAVVADSLPADGWLCGERFTLADILAGYSLRLALQTELVDPASVRAYVARLRARPAAVRSRVFASLGST